MVKNRHNFTLLTLPALPATPIFVSAFLPIITALLFTTFAFSTSAFAEDVPTLRLTDDQKGAISQHCSTIKQSLRTLQRTDARTRSYLGSIYEDLLSHYIAPLNLRMVGAGQPNTNLTNIHSEIITTRQNFINEYTIYSQSLEELISTDCQAHPDDFYAHLVKTREKRATLSTTTTNLRNLFSEHLTAVKRLRNSLGGNDAE